MRRIQSMGGGIFTYTALVTAAKMVQESDKGTRHIVLFADAADAEEPGDYQRLLETLTPLGITVSVIGLGSETDSRRGVPEGRRRARAGDASTSRRAPRSCRGSSRRKRSPSRDRASSPSRRAARALPDMVLLGELPASAFPSVDGYNLTYLRPGATMGVVTTDEYKAPVLAFWHRGLGPRRVAHRRSGRRVFAAVERVERTSRASPSGSGAGCWAASRRRACRRAFEREGAQGIVRVELDPGRTRGGADDVRAATATIVPPDDRAASASERLDLGVGRRRHARSAVPGAEGRPLPRRRADWDRRRAAARAADAALLAGIRAAARSAGRTQDAARDGARHRRHRADDVGRRVRRQPAAQPAGARSRDSAHAGAARCCTSSRSPDGGCCSSPPRGDGCGRCTCHVCAFRAAAARSSPRRRPPRPTRHAPTRRTRPRPRRRQSPRRRRWRARKPRRAIG